MQLVARDEGGSMIAAADAEKRQDYYCFECKGKVRLRGGARCQRHFFHLQPSKLCRSSGKTLEHLQTQRFIQRQLTPGDVILEHPFPSVSRIADVYWEKEKIVFEVQCSPISAQEVLERNRDYRSLGIEVVWIFHERSFAGRFVTEAEQCLRDSPHYFTDMNNVGEGSIYDCYSVIDGDRRQWHLLKLKLDLAQPHFRPFLEPTVVLPRHLLPRHRHWPVYFEGDLMSSANDSQRFSKLLRDWERRLLGSPLYRLGRSMMGMLAPHIDRYVFRPYRIWFHAMLEKHCR